jgi:phosphate-selective porin OprO and OprP
VIGAFKNSYNVGGFAVAGGDYAVTGRLTWLPWYEENGTYLTHVGVASSHRDPEFEQNRYRIRPSIRSAPGPLTQLIPVLVDTGFFGTTSQDILGLEFFQNLGPLTIQAEYMAFWNDNVTTAATGNVGTTFYQGYYVQALYWLTGEYTRWDKKAAAPDRYVVNNPFFLLPGMGCHGTGAWQFGVRWSQVDANNRGINGGMLDDLTIGLNWILNPNVKFQWNYELARRYGLGPANDGNFQGLGMRCQFDF